MDVPQDEFAERRVKKKQTKFTRTDFMRDLAKATKPLDQSDEKPKTTKS